MRFAVALPSNYDSFRWVPDGVVADRGPPRFTNLFAAAPGRARRLKGLALMTTFSVNRLGFAVAVLLSGVAGDAWGQVQYKVTDLGTLPGGTSSYPFAINNLGQIAGVSYTSIDVASAFLYSGGTMQNLNDLLGGENSVATGIDDKGQVVGYSDASGVYAFLYSNGTITDLGTLPGGSQSIARAINNLGQVVGVTENSSGFQHAFLYSGSGPMQDLGTLPGGTLSVAYDINDSGQIVGYAPTSSGAGSAFLYSGGSMQNLGSLGGSSVAYAINDVGQVVGNYVVNSGDFSGADHAFLYSGGSMQNLGTLPGGGPSSATAINDLGQVVGNAGEFGGENPDHAILWSGGTVQDLNSLIAPGSGWTLQQATGINDSGQICGLGMNPNGQQDAFLLTPTPEPSTIALLGAGALGLLAYAWRRKKRTLNA